MPGVSPRAHRHHSYTGGISSGTKTAAIDKRRNLAFGLFFAANQIVRSSIDRAESAPSYGMPPVPGRRPAICSTRGCVTCPVCRVGNESAGVAEHLKL